MNGEQRAAALALAGKGVQVDDGHTYGVDAVDLVAYGDTIRALVAELDRVAPVCSCVDDVVCGACMTGAVDPTTGVSTPPADDGTDTDALVLRAMAAALTEFADAVRMPFVVFRGENGAPITPGDLMRETAARYLAMAETAATS